MKLSVGILLKKVERILGLWLQILNNTVGVTKYIWEHTFKLQSELTFDTLNYFDGSTKNNWYLRFQVEIEYKKTVKINHHFFIKFKFEI
jgi:hypothetical protein